MVPSSCGELAAQPSMHTAECAKKDFLEFMLSEGKFQMTTNDFISGKKTRVYVTAYHTENYFLSLFSCTLIDRFIFYIGLSVPELYKRINILVKIKKVVFARFPW